MPFPDFPYTDAKNSSNIPSGDRTEPPYEHVMAFGTFDIFHLGHSYYLSEASKYAKNMTVVIARDHRVVSGKGRQSIHTEEERLQHVKKTFPNATVILGNELDILAPIRELGPDLLAFGYDQRFPEHQIQEIFPNIRTIRIAGYETNRYKSSLLRQ